MHLPNQQSITINNEMREEEISNLLLVKTTMLTAYFELNRHDEEARRFIYPDIPSYYTLKKTETRWCNYC